MKLFRTVRFVTFWLTQVAEFAKHDHAEPCAQKPRPAASGGPRGAGVGAVSRRGTSPTPA